MTGITMRFKNNRLLHICELTTPIDIIRVAVKRPFATLLPAFRNEDLAASEKIAGELVDFGCVEFCCVGPLAEQLHDSLDGIIEDKNMFNVATVADIEILDACEYFVHAAASLPSYLLALIEGNRMVVDILCEIVKTENDPI